MSALSEFREEEGPFRGAFRMDGEGRTADMRERAGMDACDCCDYFRLLGENVVVLVEDTFLPQTIENLQAEFAVAPPPLQNKTDTSEKRYINNRVTWETRLKVYGGMLVLHRIAMEDDEVAKMIRGKKFRFLLVDKGVPDKGAKSAKNERSAKDDRAAENWRRQLCKDLQSMFSPEMIDRVNVISLDELQEELPPLPPSEPEKKSR